MNAARNCLWLVLQAVAVLAVGALAVGIAVVSYDIHTNLTASDSAIRHADALIEDIGAHEFQIAQTASMAVDQAALFTIEQRALLRKTGADSDKTVKAIRLVTDRAGLLLKHADEQLNTQLLPDIDRDVGVITLHTIAAMDSGKASLDELDRQLADPHINALALHLDDTSLSLANTAASGAHVAAYWDRKLTTARGFASTVGHGAWEVFKATLTGHYF